MSYFSLQGMETGKKKALFSLIKALFSLIVSLTSIYPTAYRRDQLHNAYNERSGGPAASLFRNTVFVLSPLYSVAIY